ncbi:MAG: phosphatidate cytidylyltransferase [Aquificae bacterium]|nr:phosphatidate cytidylyltransferase [Aquificota bacterium]
MSLELRRKLFHFTSILGCAFLIKLYPLLACLALALSSLFLFLIVRKVEPVYEPLKRLVLFLERPKNYDRPGVQALWACLGLFTACLLFSADAFYGALVLAVGDAAAWLVGSHLGRLRVRDKSLEGSLAFFLASFLALLPFTGGTEALAVSLAGALAELLLPYPDDNFTVPVAASAVGWLV